MNEQFPEALSIYRKSLVLQFSIGPKSIFITGALAAGANKNGNTTYNWKNKSVMALDPVEAGALIFCIENYYNPQVDVCTRAAATSSKGDTGGLYHKSPRGGSSQLYFKGNPEKKTKPSFLINFLSENASGTKANFSTAISPAEATTLSILLRQGIQIIHRWHIILKKQAVAADDAISFQDDFKVH